MTKIEVMAEGTQSPAEQQSSFEKSRRPCGAEFARKEFRALVLPKDRRCSVARVCDLSLKAAGTLSEMPVQLFQCFRLVVQKDVLEIGVQLLLRVGIQPADWGDGHKAWSGSHIEILRLREARQMTQLTMRRLAFHRASGDHNMPASKGLTYRKNVDVVASAVFVAGRDPGHRVRLDAQRAQAGSGNREPHLLRCVQQFRQRDCGMHDR